MSTQYTSVDTRALTPGQVVKVLDKYIVGQASAKRQVAIALRNRWRTQQADASIREEITPSNLLMIGPTGVGKTEIARRLAHIIEAPFVKVEASKFTEVGYVGRDVESIIRDLMEQGITLVKDFLRKKHESAAKEAAKETLLDVLIPPIRDAQADVVNEATRKRMAERLQQGLLDDKKIELEVHGSNAVPTGMVAGGMIDDVQLSQLQDMLSSMMPKRKKKRRMTVKEAQKILVEEELNKRIDNEEVKSIALEKVQRTGIVFIDEIDKIANTNKTHTDVSGEGVQRDLLPIVEGSTVSTKYGVVRTDHILFIAAGAFHMAKPSDMIPELQGRFPIRIELQPLVLEDFKRILTEPKNALTKQYQALLQSEGVQLSFTKKAIEKLAAIAFELNIEMENIGARRLHTVVSTALSDYLFDIPDTMPKNKRISITEQAIEKSLTTLRKNKTSAQYML